MKILIINPNYYRSSGVTIALLRLSRSLTRLGHQILYASCAYSRGGEAEELAISGVRAPYFFMMSRNPLIVFASVLRLFFFLRKNAVDLIHVHHRRIAWILAFFRPFLRVPIVYTGHLTYGEARCLKLLYVDASIGVSPSVLEDIRGTIRSGYSQLISNPVDFQPRAIKTTSSSPLVCCVGRLDPVKNHRTLLAAWALVAQARPDARLFLVGEGKVRSDLERLCISLGLSEKVSFLGYRSDVAAVIDKASFCVLPSLVEGQGMATIEAAALGVPSLVSDVDGSRDCVPPGERPLPNLVPPLDVEALATALLVWLNNPGEVLKEGQCFQDYWRERASPDFVAKQTQAVYEMALEKYWS